MRLFITIISFFLLLPSCRKGEAPSSSPDDNIGKSKYVWFSSNISSEVEGDWIGRAPIDGITLPPNSEVGVFGLLAESSSPESYKLGARINGDTECQEYLENAEYIVQDDGKSLQQKYLAQWPNKAGLYDALSFYAYYPHYDRVMDYEIQGDPKIEDSYYMDIELNNQDMSKTIDYLYTGQIFKTVANDADKNVGLVFKHALSRIKFVVESTNSDVTSTVNKIVVNAYCNKKGKFYIADGTCISNSQSSLSYTYQINKDLSGVTPIVADFLLYHNIKIKYVDCYINGNKYRVYDRNVHAPLVTSGPGKFLTFKIKFSPKNLDMESVISGWEEQGSQDVNIDESTGNVTVK